MLLRGFIIQPILLKYYPGGTILADMLTLYSCSTATEMHTPQWPSSKVMGSHPPASSFFTSFRPFAANGMN